MLSHLKQFVFFSLHVFFGLMQLSALPRPKIFWPVLVTHRLWFWWQTFGSVTSLLPLCSPSSPSCIRREVTWQPFTWMGNSDVSVWNHLLFLKKQSYLLSLSALWFLKCTVGEVFFTTVVKDYISWSVLSLLHIKINYWLIGKINLITPLRW